jgi:hypothetical protein
MVILSPPLSPSDEPSTLTACSGTVITLSSGDSSIARRAVIIFVVLAIGRGESAPFPWSTRFESGSYRTAEADDSAPIPAAAFHSPGEQITAAIQIKRIKLFLNNKTTCLLKTMQVFVLKC